LYEHTVDPAALKAIMDSKELTHVEARVLLGSVMFLIPDEVQYGSETMLVRDLLHQFIKLAGSRGLLARNDPFLREAQCSLEAMNDEA
jgi:hypothetical protein